MRGPTGSARSIGSRIAALRFTWSVDQLTHSGWSEPAVRIGEGGGASDLSDPEARARSGVIVAQYHPDRALRYRCAGDDGQPTEFFGDGFGAHVIGIGGLHLAPGHVRGVVVADLARAESLGGQHL